MTSDHERVEISDGENVIIATASFPRDIAEFPLVVLATGDGPSGSKGMTWQKIVPMLLNNNIGTFLFDFTGLGDSPGIYEDLTLSRGCRNFRSVMDHVTRNGRHDKKRIGIIGASYGGNVALLEASKFPEIRAIGLKSPSAFLPEGYQIQYGSELMERWGREGFSDEVGLRYSAVVDSLFHNTFAEAAKIGVPVRIVHGTADTAVPIRHSRDLLRVLPEGSILEIDGADHWYANGDEWDVMADDLVGFMKDSL